MKLYPALRLYGYADHPSIDDILGKLKESHLTQFTTFEGGSGRREFSLDIVQAQRTVELDFFAKVFEALCANDASQEIPREIFSRCVGRIYVHDMRPFYNSRLNSLLTEADYRHLRKEIIADNPVYDKDEGQSPLYPHFFIQIVHDAEFKVIRLFKDVFAEEELPSPDHPHTTTKNRPTDHITKYLSGWSCH